MMKKAAVPTTKGPDPAKTGTHLKNRYAEMADAAFRCLLPKVRVHYPPIAFEILKATGERVSSRWVGIGQQQKKKNTN